ncbi:hypothetical protein DFH28DRAFT_923398 [Melampsora americana]|nr:hypothetical protein DFH28DRAFT_923398 [Melampsora americana]
MRTNLSTLAGLLVVSSNFIFIFADEFVPPPTPVIGGDGPRPPAVTATALPGPWTPPKSNVNINGQSYPPPSMTGMGRQMQLNSATDFCILMPPDPTTQNLVDAEAVAVTYCVNPYNNTRPFPDGFIKTAHFRKTSDYVQISGTYNPAKMNLASNDCGLLGISFRAHLIHCYNSGEYDNHGAMGVGNPVGAAVDGAHDFMQFIGGCDIPGNAVFCLRACHGPNSYAYCKNTYDLMGCLWTMPGDYEQPGFTNCEANLDLPVGAYPGDGTATTSTFVQGQTPTPLPVAAPASSLCQTSTSPAASGVTYYWDGTSPAVQTGAANAGKNGSSGQTDASRGSKSDASILKINSLMVITFLVGGYLTYIS